MKKIKVAFFVRTFPSVSETFILNQICGLIDLGVDIDIYASIHPQELKVHPQVKEYNLLKKTYYSDSDESLFKRTAKGIKTFSKNFRKNPLLYTDAVRSRSLRSVFFVDSFISNSLKKSYDIIHAHFGANGLIGMYLKKSGVYTGKLITSFHGYDFSRSIRQKGSGFYNELFKIGDLFTVNTNFTKKNIMDIGCAENKIIKLSMGLDINFFRFCERNLQEGAIVKLLTIGRLVEKKGLEYSIKAVANVAKMYPNIEYNIIGDGELRERLERLIHELNMSHKIKLLGSKTQDEVKQLFQESHVFILPSVTASNGDMEGQGLVLQEAQAVGLPVLSTLHNGIPEGVVDGKSGFLVPEKDVHSMSEKLYYLIIHPELWGEMGRIGREFVEKNYDIKKLNLELLKIYENVLARGKLE